MNQYLSKALDRHFQQDRSWGNPSLLKSLKNPTAEPYEVRIHCPEVTFIGKKEQPDFACIEMAMYPTARIVELKSLKRYLFSFRERLMSYERFINVLYEDLWDVYRPARLIVEIELRARGGISSHLKVDSAWRTGGRSGVQFDTAAFPVEGQAGPVQVPAGV